MSERPASSGENSTLSVYSRAHFTARTACSITCEGSMRSFFSMWMGEVAMKVCTRGDLRLLHRLAAAADVVLVGAREPADGAVLDRARHRPHRLEIAVARGREARPRSRRRACARAGARCAASPPRHRRAGALLAVAHRRVEYDQFFFAMTALRSVMPAAAARRATRISNHARGGLRRARTQLQTTNVGEGIMRRARRSSRPASRRLAEKKRRVACAMELHAAEYKGFSGMASAGDAGGRRSRTAARCDGRAATGVLAQRGPARPTCS